MWLNYLLFVIIYLYYKIIQTPSELVEFRGRKYNFVDKFVNSVIRTSLWTIK